MAEAMPRFSAEICARFMIASPMSMVSIRAEVSPDLGGDNGADCLVRMDVYQLLADHFIEGFDAAGIVLAEDGQPFVRSVVVPPQVQDKNRSHEKAGQDSSLAAEVATDDIRIPRRDDWVAWLDAILFFDTLYEASEIGIIGGAFR